MGMLKLLLGAVVLICLYTIWRESRAVIRRSRKLEKLDEARLSGDLLDIDRDIISQNKQNAFKEERNNQKRKQ